MERYVRSALVALGLLVLQTTFIPFLSIQGFLPDLFVIWIVYVAIRRGQLEASVAGFVVGLLQDVLAPQFLGLGAMAKTICGFIAGYFYNENNTEQTLGSYRFLLIVVLCSMIQSIVYYGIFFQGIQESVITTTLAFSLATSAYTGLVGMLPLFAFVRRYRISQSL